MLLYSTRAQHSKLIAMPSILTLTGACKACPAQTVKPALLCWGNALLMVLRSHVFCDESFQ